MRKRIYERVAEMSAPPITIVEEPPCEEQAWVYPETNETRLFPVCSELWDRETERLLNSGDWVPLNTWLQKNKGKPDGRSGTLRT